MFGHQLFEQEVIFSQKTMAIAKTDFSQATSPTLLAMICCFAEPREGVGEGGWGRGGGGGGEGKGGVALAVSGKRRVAIQHFSGGWDGGLLAFTPQNFQSVLFRATAMSDHPGSLVVALW